MLIANSAVIVTATVASCRYGYVKPVTIFKLVYDNHDHNKCDMKHKKLSCVLL